MPNSLVLNCNPHVVRVALVEDAKVAEIFIERRREASVVGNIYKGRVIRVLPGMQAAFVEIGLERAAFLYVADVAGPRRSNTGTSTISEARSDLSLRPIQSLLTEGQEIMVQVSKEPLGTKGARVTSNVSIAGRHLVYMPTVDHIGISRRIADEEERRRLKDILEMLVPQGGGFVARTAAEGRTPEELRADLEFLRQVWNDILTRMESVPAPATLYEDLDLVLRAVRDLVTPDMERIIVDDADEFERLSTFMRRFMPRYHDRVVHYDEAEPIFDTFGVEIELSRALGRKVWLKSGGYLIIDQTEALAAIDVNTGRYVGKRTLEDTILRTNLEAVDEVVSQLRLRNIGGIIIIDFIDMEQESNRERLYGALAEALLADRSKTNILKVSELGLVEMTRKRVRDTLLRTLSEPCFYCGGTGYLKSRTSVALEIYRVIIRDEAQHTGDQITIAVHPRIAEVLQDSERALITDLETRLNKSIEVRTQPRFHLEQFEIRSSEE